MAEEIKLPTTGDPARSASSAGYGRGLHRLTVEKISADALEESGGDGCEDVSITYTFLLELLDCYRASGWMRELGPSMSHNKKISD